MSCDVESAKLRCKNMSLHSEKISRIISLNRTGRLQPESIKRNDLSSIKLFTCSCIAGTLS